jgi:acylphosphatase
MLVARRFLITGRVQGVGFRYFVEDLARHEGAGGWVRNLPDGRVEALVEADEESMMRIEARIRRGPASARVSTVDVTSEMPSGRRLEFRIE